MRVLPLALFALGFAASGTQAQFSEVEPNDDKSTATLVNGLGPGGTVTGTSTGSATGGGTNSVDYYLIRLAPPAVPGIYRHTFILSPVFPFFSNPYTFNALGLSQSGSFGVGGTISATEAITQFNGFLPTVPFIAFRAVFFYSVGTPADLYVKVSGASTTTSPYTISVLTALVTPSDLGTFAPGSITVETTSYGPLSLPTPNPNEGSDLWVYDANLQPIPGYGNDNGSPTNRNARLVRPYPTGTYYVALTNFNLANDQASPSDENVYRPVLDFPNVVLTSFGGTLQSAGLRVSDGIRTTTPFAVSTMLSSEVFWYKFEVTCDPAAIAMDPVSTEVCVGNAAAFATAASGTAPVSFQWRKDGTDILGATASTFSIGSAVSGDAGTYDVVASNACGQATSDPAILVVHPEGPEITAHPTGGSLCLGETATFTVVASPHMGEELSYQWRKDGSAILNAIASTYAVLVTGLGDGGQYDCVVTECDCGSSTSTPAVLVVRNEPPVISLADSEPLMLECHVDAYVEPGAVANDDCDGTVDVVIGGDTVDSNAPGLYQVTYDAVDSQGNDATQVVRNVVVQDTLGPVVTIASPGPGDGTVYLLHQDVASSYECVDSCDAGPLDCSGPVPSGDLFDTSVVGPKEFPVISMDVSGNPSAMMRFYEVRYASAGLCLGEPTHKVLQPVNPDGTSVFKKNSVVHVRFRVSDADGVSIGSPPGGPDDGVVTSFTLVQVNSGTVAPTVTEQPLSVTPNSSFHWDETDQQWTFNLSTKNLTANHTYEYRIDLNDGSSIDFSFGLK